MVLSKSMNRWTFPKIKNLIFVQNFDGYICIFGIKLKGLLKSFILGFMQWNSNVLNIFFLKKKHKILPRTVFLKLENLLYFNTYFPQLRNIVMKLLDDKCEAKADRIVSAGLMFKKLYFFMQQLWPSLKDKM